MRQGEEGEREQGQRSEAGANDHAGQSGQEARVCHQVPKGGADSAPIAPFRGPRASEPSIVKAC
jgi:hypothetical protein